MTYEKPSRCEAQPLHRFQASPEEDEYARQQRLATLFVEEVLRMCATSPEKAPHDRTPMTRFCAAVACTEHHTDIGRWATIRYALDSNGRTMRFVRSR
jgi:hypothetical protein